MKKNIEFVSLDPSTINWLLKELRAAPENSKCAGELSVAISGLSDGSLQTLILESGEAVFDLNFPEITCGELHIFPMSRKVLRGDEEILLTPKEYDILLFLAKNRGEVFTKEQIYQAVWEADYLMDDSNIMAFIRKLRKKIEPHPDAPKYILTIWGIGYKFNDKL